MLTDDVLLRLNLFTGEARDALTTTLERRKVSREPGIIQESRLRRNLLSSQPLCFNLFGYLVTHPGALLPWVRTISPRATEVLDVQLESAPAKKPIGGSAFDACVVYQLIDGSRGFFGVECKYAEDLKRSQTKPARAAYRKATASTHWLTGAADALDVSGLRQFWYNTLLAQQVQRDDRSFCEGYSVVVAMAGDHSARAATADVASQLSEPSCLRFSSLQDVVASVQGHDDWRSTFTRRYLDLSPSE
jgi:hypothetical protein